jgi:hypothetical protein
VHCPEREHLESALNDALNRHEELANRKVAEIRRGESGCSRFDGKITRATERVNQAQQLLQAHNEGHGCS